MTEIPARRLLQRLGVVIPAYNPGLILPDILCRILELVPPEQILVVDDGSTDQTSARVESLGVLLYRHPGNRGKGAALATGFRIMAERDFDYLLTLDADGQHDPAAIPRFLAALTPGCGMIIGDRSQVPGEMPRLRRFSNSCSSSIVSALCGQAIPDSQCGFRLMRTELLRGLELSSTHYEFETELLLKIARTGQRITSLPVSSLYFSEASRIRKLRDTFRFAGLILRSFFWRRADAV